MIIQYQMIGIVDTLIYSIKLYAYEQIVYVNLSKLIFVLQ